MSVTASFEPGRVSSEPGGTAAFILRLHNGAPTDEVVRLRAGGELAKQTVLQSETVYLDPNETFEVPVVVDIGAGLPAGPHSSTIEVLAADGAPSIAEATIDVLEARGYAIDLVPEHSRSSAAGRHKVTIANIGNIPITVELTPAASDDGVRIELATPTVSVYPGDTAKVDVRVVPPDRFWSGPMEVRNFEIRATADDGTTHELPGTFEQGPRLRPWFLPVAAGTAAVLLLGTLAWFTLLKPYVDQTAEDAAVAAIVEDRAVLRDLITELEEAAAEAKELPLGEPADLRLAVSPAPSTAASDAFAVSGDRVLSVTDVVLQNPSGAVGVVTLLRDGQVLLESQLANFRDLDFHFVAPFRFDGGSTVELRVECTTAGPNETECPVASTIVGFVDQAG